MHSIGKTGLFLAAASILGLQLGCSSSSSSSNTQTVTISGSVQSSSSSGQGLRIFNPGNLIATLQLSSGASYSASVDPRTGNFQFPVPPVTGQNFLVTILETNRQVFQSLATNIPAGATYSVGTVGTSSTLATSLVRNLARQNGLSATGQGFLNQMGQIPLPGGQGFLHPQAVIQNLNSSQGTLSHFATTILETFTQGSFGCSLEELTQNTCQSSALKDLQDQVLDAIRQSPQVFSGPATPLPTVFPTPTTLPTQIPIPTPTPSPTSPGTPTPTPSVPPLPEGPIQSLQVSILPNGTPTNVTAGTGPIADMTENFDFSSDGEWVVFGTGTEIFLRNVAQATTTRIDVDAQSQPGNGPSAGVQISPDGRWIAFKTRATNLAPAPGTATGTGGLLVQDRTGVMPPRLVTASFNPNTGDIVSLGNDSVVYNQGSGPVDPTGLCTSRLRRFRFSDGASECVVFPDQDKTSGVEGSPGNRVSVSDDGTRFLFDLQPTRYPSNSTAFSFPTGALVLFDGSDYHCITRSVGGDCEPAESLFAQVSGDGSRVLYSTGASGSNRRTIRYDVSTQTFAQVLIETNSIFDLFSFVPQNVLLFSSFLRLSGDGRFLVAEGLHHQLENNEYRHLVVDVVSGRSGVYKRTDFLSRLGQYARISGDGKKVFHTQGGAFQLTSRALFRVASPFFAP